MHSGTRHVEATQHVGCNSLIHVGLSTGNLLVRSSVNDYIYTTHGHSQPVVVTHVTQHETYFRVLPTQFALFNLVTGIGNDLCLWCRHLHVLEQRLPETTCAAGDEHTHASTPVVVAWRTGGEGAPGPPLVARLPSYPRYPTPFMVTSSRDSNLANRSDPHDP